MNTTGDGEKGRRASTRSWAVGSMETVRPRCRTIGYLGIQSKLCPGRILIEADGREGSGWAAVVPTADFLYAKRTFVQVYSAEANREHGIIKDYYRDCCFTYIVYLVESKKTVYVPENYVTIDSEAAHRALQVPPKKRHTWRKVQK